MNLSEVDPILQRKLMHFSRTATPYRDQSPVYNDLVVEWCDKLGKRKKNAIEWWWTNATRAMKNRHVGLRVSMKANNWSTNTCGIGYRAVCGVLDSLEEENFVVRYTGSHIHGLQTIFAFTDKLERLLLPRILSVNLPFDHVANLVILKDRDDKHEIKIEEDVEYMIDQINRYNQSVHNTKIEFMGQQVPLTEYVRSFSGDLFSGGRLFVHGGGVQTLPARYRSKHLTIDGCKIVELDYNAMHPSLLYERVLQKLLSDLTGCFSGEVVRCPYSPWETASKDDTEALKAVCNGDFRAMRQLNKIALMVMINSKSEVSARSAINYALHEDRKKPKIEQKLQSIGKLNTKLVMDELSRHNHLIADYFYSDEGLKLQKIESDIALVVLDKLIQNGETALAYHDSFCVKEDVGDLLTSFMYEAWLEVVGSNTFCKVDKK